MNLPEYKRAIDRAVTEYDDAVNSARQQLQKTMAVIQQEFFEDTNDDEDNVSVMKERPYR